MIDAAASDEALARALASGDRQAFDPFVDRFQRRLFQYSYLVCGVREDAEEVAQDTLMKAFQSLDTLRDAAKVKPWLFRIAKNVCLMKRRRSMFAPEQELSLDDYTAARDTGPARQIASDDAPPDSELFRRQRNEAIAQAIRNLPQSYRAVVLLRDVEGLSSEEAAEILDISVDNLKQRLHRARLAMRKELQPYA